MPHLTSGGKGCFDNDNNNNNNNNNNNDNDDNDNEVRFFFQTHRPQRQQLVDQELCIFYWTAAASYMNVTKNNKQKV